MRFNFKCDIEKLVNHEIIIISSINLFRPRSTFWISAKDKAYRFAFRHRWDVKELYGCVEASVGWEQDLTSFLSLVTSLRCSLFVILPPLER
jgi:hypothetical protein